MVPLSAPLFTAVRCGAARSSVLRSGPVLRHRKSDGRGDLMGVFKS
jgi:hypothetical protein